MVCAFKVRPASSVVPLLHYVLEMLLKFIGLLQVYFLPMHLKCISLCP